MKTIDCRLRPPVGAYAKDFLFVGAATGRTDITALQHGCTVSPSAKAASMTLLLQEMDECEVEKGIFAIRKSSNCGNELLWQFDQTTQERFIIFAGMSPREGSEQCLQEIKTYVQNGPALGVAMEPAIAMDPQMGYTPWYADEESVYPIYDYCMQNAIPVMLTYGGRLPADASYYRPEAIEHVAQLFPDLTLILVHGGWPWIVPNCSLALNYRNVYLCPDMYLVNAPGYRDYIDAANHFLTKKMTSGSAYPLLAIKDAKEFYLHCGIKEHILPDILYHNIAQALKLESISSQ